MRTVHGSVATKLRLVALMAVVALVAGACGSGSDDTDAARFGALDQLCETAPVGVPGIVILGQYIESVDEVEVCVDRDVDATGVPAIVNQPDCGEPCFTIEVQNLDVGADVGIVVNYKRGKTAQDPIEFNPERAGVSPDTGRICVVGVGGPPNPCTDRLTQPKNLTAAAKTTSITLSWQKSVDTGGTEITGYQVWRSETGEPGTFQHIGTATGTSYSDTSVVKDMTYHYYVVATNADGDTSDQSNVAQATAAQEEVKQNPKRKDKKSSKKK